MTFTNWTVGKKLGFTSGAALALTGILAVVANVSLKQVGTGVRTLTDDTLPGVMYMGAIQADVGELRGNFWKHIASSNQQQMTEIERSVDTVKARLVEHMGLYEKYISQDEDRASFATIKQGYERYIAAWQMVRPLSFAGKNAEAYRTYIQNADPVHKALSAAIQASVDWNKRYADKTTVVATEAVTRGQTLSVIIAVLAIGLGGGLMFFVVRSINRVLRQAVSDLSGGAEQVASAAAQVSASSQSLAQGSSEQAASLEETSASSEEINSMALKNAENSRTAAELVGQSQLKFSETNKSLQDMVVAMSEINASSEKISKIIKVIDEIAFQTNILALNAAVEAARAGEAGMGFAVVADEVRNLAQRCAQAAKDTTALIEESVTKSNEGKIKVDHVAAGIQTITEQSVRVKTLVDEVNLGSEEQAKGIEQVAKAITQMEQVTQTTAASAEEGASAASELTAQSESVKDVVAQLAAMVGAAASKERAVRRTAPRSNPKVMVPVAAGGRNSTALPRDNDFPEF